MEKEESEVERKSPLIRQQLYAEEMFGSAALVVIGEPTSEEHKNAILERIAHGLASWNSEATGCDINAELNAVTDEAPAGVGGDNGEHIVKHGSDTFQLEVIVNPRRETLKEGIRVLLLPPTNHKHIIFAGYTFTGTGDWVVQDGIWSCSDLISIFKQADVELALNEQKDSTLTIHCGSPCGQWTEEKLNKTVVGKSLKLSVNPSSVVSGSNEIIEFTRYISNLIKVVPTQELLEASDVVGNIRFMKPTLYIFPAAQGDCAVFGVQGFNMLLDGGFSRRSCFWDFTRHLDRLDVLLISRISQDNLFGMKSFLQRRMLDKIHPEITYSFFNSTMTKENDCSSALSISLSEEGSLVDSYLSSLGCKSASAYASPKPIQLYNKIGHGALDMYVLNPHKESADYREMMKQWTTSDSFTHKAGVPLNELCSIATMLVWKSSAGDLTRILYPGSTPQSEVLKSLDHLKDLDTFKYPNGSKTASKLRKPVGKYVREPSEFNAAPVATGDALADVVPEPTPEVVPPPIIKTDNISAVTISDDIAAEPLLDIPNDEQTASAASPRDAWIDSNEPVSLPEPVQTAGQVIDEPVLQPESYKESEATTEPLVEEPIAAPEVVCEQNSAPEPLVTVEPPASIEESSIEQLEAADEESQQKLINGEGLHDESQSLTEESEDLDQVSEQKTAADQITEEAAPAVTQQEINQEEEETEEQNQKEVEEEINAELTQKQECELTQDELVEEDRNLSSGEAAEEVDTSCDSVQQLEAAHDANEEPHEDVDTTIAEQNVMDQIESEEVTKVETAAEESEMKSKEDELTTECVSADNEAKQADEDDVKETASFEDVAEDNTANAVTEDNTDGTEVEQTAEDNADTAIVEGNTDSAVEEDDAEVEQTAEGTGAVESNETELVTADDTLAAAELVTADDTPAAAELVTADDTPTEAGVKELTAESAAEEITHADDRELCENSEKTTEANVAEDTAAENVGSECDVSGEDVTESGELAEQEIVSHDDRKLGEDAEVSLENSDEAQNNLSGECDEAQSLETQPSSEDNVTVQESTEDSIEPAEEQEVDQSSEENPAPLMTSSQEEMFRTMAEEQHGEPVGVAQPSGSSEELSAEIVDTRDQLEYSDSIENVGSSVDVESREDSLEPSLQSSNQDRSDEQPSKDESDDLAESDEALPPTTTDPMTQSFIDESTQGQSDPMTDSFIDLTVTSTNDPMTQSFIDESTMGADSNSLEGSSEVDKCSNVSLVNSTPALTELESAGDASSLNDKSMPDTPASRPEDPPVTSSSDNNEQPSNSDLNPFAPEFKPSSVETSPVHSSTHPDSQSEGQKTEDLLSTEGQKTEDLLSSEGQKTGDLLSAEGRKTEDLLSSEGQKTDDLLSAEGQKTGDLLSGWIDDGCSGCQTEQPKTTSTEDSKPADPVAEFDPLKEWGEPQHLPHPPSPTPVENSQSTSSNTPTASTESKESKANGEKAPAKTKSATKTRSAASGDGTKAAGPKKTLAAKKTISSPSSRLAAASTKKPTSTADDKSKSDKPPPKPARLSNAAGSSLSKPSRPTSNRSDKPLSKDKTDAKKPKQEIAKPERKPTTLTDRPKPKTRVDSAKLKPLEKKLDSKSQAAESKADRTKADVKKTKTDDVKKPRLTSAKTKTAASKSTPASTAKSATSKGPVIYVDLAYVPHQGDSKYVGMEYFQVVHARYYVFSGLNPSAHAFDALLSAKSSWDADPVTIIATYDSDVLHRWINTNRSQLEKLNIDVTPSANRCFIQLADDKNSFPALRLEF